MPSSLVFAALVLAWLAVLVPVVARRRQLVPRPAEADLSARVLPRAAGAPANEELPVTPPCSDRGGQTLSRSGGGSATAVIDRSPTRRGDEGPVGDLDAELDGELDLDAYDGEEESSRGARIERPAGATRVDADEYGYDDAYDTDRGHDGYDDGDRDGDDDAYGYDEYVDDDRADVAPRSYRPGRGGFDPDAAEVAAQSRYTFRQRVALGLIAVAVLSAVAALVVSPTLWWLHLLVDVVLVGYLVFLRRQTRLEEELRVRRAARLSGERRAVAARRERQAEHEARLEAMRRATDGWHQDDDRYEDEYEYDDGYDDHDDRDDRDDVEADEAPRWAAPRTPAPSVPDGMELVGDSSDDPAFHRLDGRERVPSYRRAAGA